MSTARKLSGEFRGPKKGPTWRETTSSAATPRSPSKVVNTPRFWTAAKGLSLLP